MSELIITNGQTAVNLLTAAGIGDSAFAWNDVLHEGPVPLTGTLAELSQIRADFFAALGDIDVAVVRRRFAERDTAFRNHRDHERIVLWFEHDLYDQLQLIQILDALSTQDGRENDLFLVQAPDYIAACAPEKLHEIARLEQDVSLDQRVIARAAWAAFRQPRPVSWAALLDVDTHALPYLRAAVQRTLEDLPAPGTGLSRTEWQMVAAVAAGADRPHTLFRAVQQMEQAVFMGDLTFWRWLDGLAFAREPLVGGVREGGIAAARAQDEIRSYLTQQISVTDFGRAVLARAADHALVNGIDRWLGGTHLTTDMLWRWDARQRRLIAPQ